MAGKITKRLGKEIQLLLSSLPPGVLDVHIDEKNMHIVHFLCQGPPDTPFEAGKYIVKIVLPRDYPMSPPDFMMLTPNGRFQTGAKICTSFSSYHPETWSASYTLTTLILSFISFMAEENSAAAGVVHCSKAEREKFARESVAWNIRHNYGKMLPKLLAPDLPAAAAPAQAPASRAAPAAAAPVSLPANVEQRAAPEAKTAQSRRPAEVLEADKSAPHKRTASGGAASQQHKRPRTAKPAASGAANGGEVVDLALCGSMPLAPAAGRGHRAGRLGPAIDLSKDTAVPVAAGNSAPGGADIIDLT